MQTDFSKFLKCLNLYLDLDLFDNLIIYKDSQVKIYGLVTLENGIIMYSGAQKICITWTKMFKSK